MPKIWFFYYPCYKIVFILLIAINFNNHERLLMNKLLMGLMLVFVSSSAMAEWTYFADTDEHVDYIDLASIRKSGSISSAWTLTNYIDLQTVGGDKYFSFKILREFDCNKNTFRTLAFTEYSKHMGSGLVVFTNDDEFSQRRIHVVPDSFGQLAWQIACGKQ